MSDRSLTLRFHGGPFDGLEQAADAAVAPVSVDVTVNGTTHRYRAGPPPPTPGVVDLYDALLRDPTVAAEVPAAPVAYATAMIDIAANPNPEVGLYARDVVWYPEWDGSGTLHVQRLIAPEPILRNFLDATADIACTLRPVGHLAWPEVRLRTIATGAGAQSLGMGLRVAVTFRVRPIPRPAPAED